jgi:hypothetical protein
MGVTLKKAGFEKLDSKGGFVAIIFDAAVLTS